MVANKEFRKFTICNNQFANFRIIVCDQTFPEAYSAAGGMGFGWWLVEHYLPYHVDCPDGCGLGETAGGG